MHRETIIFMSIARKYSSTHTVTIWKILHSFLKIWIFICYHLPSACRTSFFIFLQLRSAGNEFSWFSFIWKHAYFAFITEGFFFSEYRILGFLFFPFSTLKIFSLCFLASLSLRRSQLPFKLFPYTQYITFLCPLSRFSLHLLFSAIWLWCDQMWLFFGFTLLEAFWDFRCVNFFLSPNWENFSHYFFKYLILLRFLSSLLLGFQLHSLRPLDIIPQAFEAVDVFQSFLSVLQVVYFLLICLWMALFFSSIIFILW